MASVIVVGRQSRREHRLDGAVTVVGRDAGANLELGDLQVSRRHALLVQARQGFFIKDLGSRNGVLLNQERVPSRQQALLKNGDVLFMGRTTLIFKEVLEGVDLEDGPPTPTIVQTVAVPRVAPAALPQLVTPAADPAPPAPPAPAAARSGAPAPRAPAPRAAPRRRERAPANVDALTLQTLIERTERDRQFFRNLSLVLLCLLITTLVLLFAYALFQRNSETAEGEPPTTQASPTQSPTQVAFSLDHEVFAKRVHPVLRQRCAECHSQGGKGGALLIATSDDPQTVADNLAAVRAFVTPGQPEKSPLLLKPLAADEGGLEHGGGALLHMDSPEWKALRTWVTSLRSGQAAQSLPTARVVAPATVALGLALALRGNTSQPASGGALRHRWSLLETPAGSQARLQDSRSATARLTPDLPGRYSVMLEVMEGDARATATHTFRARATEQTAGSPSATPRTPPSAAAPRVAPKPAAPAADLGVVQRLLGRAPTAADRQAQEAGVGALRAHLLKQEALYARWWSLELEHLGLTHTHRPSGEPWDSLPAKLRSGRFNVLDVYYALLVGQDWSDRYPDSERAVEVMLDRLLGADAAKDKELKRRALRLLEGHSASLLGTQAEGQVGLVRAVVRSKKAAERLCDRSHFRITGKRLSPQALATSVDRFLKDPNSYFGQLVAWGLR